MAQIESWTSQSKKASCQLAKFHYHLNNTIPDLFQQESNTPSSPRRPILQSRKGPRNMTFYFAEHSADGVSSLDEEAILESARKLYVSSDCVRVSAGCFRRSSNYKVPYLPVYGRFHQIIQFHLLDKNDASNHLRSTLRHRPTSTLAKKIQEENMPLQSIVKMPNNFQLFVVHHCQADAKDEVRAMRWESFIERYRFVEEKEGTHKIHYSLLLSYEEEEGLLNYLSPHNRLYDSFLGDYLAESEGGLKNLSRMQGFLMLSRERVDKKLRELSDPSFQQNHKRWLRLPSEYFKMFTTLKKHLTSYYNSIHPQPAHPEHFLNNLLCRYMYAKEYNHKETLEAAMDYLKWEKNMADTYNLTMFANIHKIDFFTFLGYDYEGRVVLLNRAANLRVDEIADVEEYCNYYMYYLEIWLQKKWKGYADQYTVIADLQGLGSDNFKLAITKRNLGDGLKYCPERQHKMIVVNIGAFAHFVWSILKPLIPKRTIHKLSMVGTDRADILEMLTKEMDISVIPEYLGGKNTRIFSDDLLDEDNDGPIVSSS